MPHPTPVLLPARLIEFSECHSPLDRIAPMAILRYRPAAPLGLYVDALWWSRRDLPQDAGEHMLPSGSPQLIVALHGKSYTWRRSVSDPTPNSWTRGVLHGPQHRYFVADPKPSGAVVGVSFRPGAADTLVGVPATELADRHVPIDDIWGARGRSLQEHLLDLAEPMAVLRALERELLNRLAHPRTIHPAIAKALAEPEQSWGFTRIAGIQRQAGYSPKHFIALFRHVAGLTPKHYCRVKRFGAALNALSSDAGSNLAALAASLGYADQSHMTREFRELAGITPTQYRPRDSGSALHHVPADNPPRRGKKSSIPT